MSSLFFLSAALLATLTPITSSAKDIGSCLPAGTQPNDVVSTRVVPAKGAVIKVTVAQKLKELKARCRKHKLVDGKGREIRFYQLIGCWGNPPADYQEQLEHQAQELANLRKRYRVIEMTCDPEGVDRMRAGPPAADP